MEDTNTRAIELIKKLQNASTAEEQTWVITKTLIQKMPPDLQESAWSAAIPHWFNTKILAALLECSLESSEEQYKKLQNLPFVEAFYGKNSHNYHEFTRKIILQKLWQDHHEKFVTFSSRMVTYFDTRDEDLNPDEKIEYVYHLLIADPKRAADVVIALGTDWHKQFKYNLVHALAQAGMEQIEAKRTNGLPSRTQGWLHYWQGIAEFLQEFSYTSAISEFDRAHKLSGDDLLLKANSLKGLAETNLNLYQFEEARDQFQKALNIYQAISDRQGEAECIQDLGDLHLRQSNYKEAKQFYNRAGSIYHEINYEAREATTIKSLGDVYVTVGNNKKALKKYETALSVYQKKGTRKWEADCLLSIADIYRRQDSYESAQTNYDQALSIFQEIGDKLGEANCQYEIGNLLARKGEHKTALDKYQLALKLYESVKDLLWEANCRKSKGDIHRKLDELEEAEREYQLALSAYEKAKNKLAQADCVRSLGNLKMKLGKPDEAYTYYSQALSTYQQIESEQGIPNCLKSIGDSYRAREKYQEAIDYYRQALPFYISQKNLLGQADCQTNLGLALIELSHRKQARQNLNQAASIYKEIDHKHREIKVLSLLQELEDVIWEPPSPEKYTQNNN